MFLRLSQSSHIPADMAALEYARKYISNALNNIDTLRHKGDKRAFLCGRAGIHAVAAVIASKLNKTEDVETNIREFRGGIKECRPKNISQLDSDEVLVGRAGYLSGIYWLNENLHPKPFEADEIMQLCQTMVDSGREYATANKSSIPLMYQYHGTEYLGAAHGICAIYHMMLECPWFKKTDSTTLDFPNISQNNLTDIRNSIDAFLGK